MVSVLINFKYFLTCWIKIRF